MSLVLRRGRVAAAVGLAGLAVAYRLWQNAQRKRALPPRNHNHAPQTTKHSRGDDKDKAADKAHRAPRENHLQRILRILIPALNHNSTCARALLATFRLIHGANADYFFSFFFWRAGGSWR